MELHTNYSQRVVLDTHSLPWVASPQLSVDRKFMEGDGDEVARATAIVRYQAGAQFQPPEHDLGEEIFVLDGEIIDEHGQYTAGSYVRNPPGFSHHPVSPDGCTLLVKVMHVDSGERERVVVDSANADWFQGMVPGLTVMPLAEFGGEHTALVRWAAGTYFKPHRHYGGEEIFVIDGVFED